MSVVYLETNQSASRAGGDLKAPALRSRNDRYPTFTVVAQPVTRSAPGLGSWFTALLIAIGLLALWAWLSIG